MKIIDRFLTYRRAVATLGIGASLVVTSIIALVVLSTNHG